MKIKASVCVALNGGIGKNNQLLGHTPGDLAIFQSLTDGHGLLMGNKTARSLPNGNPLANRYNYVMCREHEVQEFADKGFIPVCRRSMDIALSEVVMDIRGRDANADLWIIGGGVTYDRTLAFVEELHLTLNPALPMNADVFFPLHTLSRYDFTFVSADTNGLSNGCQHLVFEHANCIKI